jgi:hypothetical protein
MDGFVDATIEVSWSKVALSTWPSTSVMGVRSVLLSREHGLIDLDNMDSPARWIGSVVQGVAHGSSQFDVHRAGQDLDIYCAARMHQAPDV